MQRTEIDAIIAAARKNSEFMHSAIRVGLAFEELRKAVIADFASELHRQLSNGGRIVNVKPWLDQPTGYWTGFSVRHAQWPDGIKLKVEAQNGGTSDYIIGIIAPTKEKRNGEAPFVSDGIRAAILGAANKRLGGGRSSPGWAWYQSVDREWRDFSTTSALDALVEKNSLIASLSTTIAILEEATDEALATPTLAEL